MGKFPVEYMGSLANGVCMGGLIPVLFNIAILSMDVDVQGGISRKASVCTLDV